MDPKPLSAASKAILERLIANMKETARAAQDAQNRANEFISNTLAALEIDPESVTFDVKSMAFLPKPPPPPPVEAAPAAPAPEPAP